MILPEPEVSTLQHGLRLLRRRWWIALAIAVAVPAAAYVLTSRQSKVYSSTAEVLVAQPDLPNAASGNIQSTLATHADLARVPQVAWQTIRAAGAVGQLTIGGFLTSSSVATTPNSNVIDLTVHSGSPRLAQRLATAYARQFVAYRGQLALSALSRARSSVELQLRRLKAHGQSASAVYTSLLDEDAQLRTLEALERVDTSVVQTGTRAAQIQPRPVRNVALALVLGVLLGLGVAFLVDVLDTRVRSTAEVRDQLGLPLLTRLPSPPRRMRPAAPSDAHGPYAEAMRTLRALFARLASQSGTRIVAVSSAMRREGKSTTIANLAVALARGGFDVVLVDLDLHRPRIADLFGISSDAPGLTDVALGESDLDEALHEIALPPRRSRTVMGANGNATPGHGGSLHVLPTGPVPPDAGEFVGTETVHDLIAAAAERADIVLVDTPPLLGVSDTLAISPALDALLVVMRLNTVERAALAELRRKLDEMPTKKLGYVLTAADVDERFTYYKSPYSRRTFGRRPRRLRDPIA